MSDSNTSLNGDSLDIAELGEFSEIYDNRRECCECCGMDWPGKKPPTGWLQKASCQVLRLGVAGGLSGRMYKSG